MESIPQLGDSWKDDPPKPVLKTPVVKQEKESDGPMSIGSTTSTTQLSAKTIGSSASRANTITKRFEHAGLKWELTTLGESHSLLTVEHAKEEEPSVQVNVFVQDQTVAYQKAW